MSLSRERLRRERMEITLSDTINLFVITKETEGRSPKTTTWYRDLLTRFSDYLGNPRLAQVSIDDARRFIAYLQAKETRWEDHPISKPVAGKLSTSTIHAYIRALKAFSNWAAEEGFVKFPPFTRLKKPRLPETMIEVLSDDEVKRLLEAINPNCILGARLYAMVLLLLDTGIRASELTTLTLDNTSLDECCIKVNGKGNKERIVPFGVTTKKALLRYIHTFRPEPNDGVKVLFLNEDGDRLTSTGLAQAIKRLGIKAGIPRLHPHLLRHSFAVKFLMAGGDIMSLKRMLGHTSLSVTQVYLKLADSDVQNQHRKFSPVDRMGLGNTKRNRTNGYR